MESEKERIKLESKRILKFSTITLLTVLVFSMIATTASAYQASWTGLKPPTNPSQTVTSDYLNRTENSASGTHGKLVVDCYVLNYVQNPGDNWATVTCDVGITTTLLQQYIDYNSQHSLWTYISSVSVTDSHPVNSQDSLVAVQNDIGVCAPECSNTFISPTQLATMSSNYRTAAGVVLGFALGGLAAIFAPTVVPLWMAFGMTGTSMAAGLYDYLAPQGYTPRYSDAGYGSSDLNLKWTGRNGWNYGSLYNPDGSQTEYGWIYFRLLWHIRTDGGAYWRSQQIVLQVSVDFGYWDSSMGVGDGYNPPAVGIETISAPITLNMNPTPSSTIWTAMTNPSGHNYHFSQISTPYVGYHIDTAGYSGLSEGGFDFFGYTTSTFQVGADGAIRVQGYFRQYDTFTPDLAPTRRFASLYVMYSSDLSTIVKRVDIFDYTDGTNWKYRDVVISGLNPNSAVIIGVGRPDRWATDWALTVEWAGVQVSTTTFNWAGQTSPSGHFVRSYSISKSYGPGWHVDTIGSGDGGYNMYAYSSQNFVVGQDGKIRVTGYFHQYDTLDQYGLQAGRRLLRVYVLNPNTPSTIITNVLVLQYTDGTGWVYKDVTISGLTPGSTVKIGFGREDNWAYDWQVTAEWAGISIIS